jgi:predicted MFS family arabinose efflux permease
VLGLTFCLFTYQGLTAFFPTYLIIHEHIGQGLASGIFTLLFVDGGLIQLVADSLANRYGTPSVLVGVALVDVVTLVAVPLIDGRVTWVAISSILGARMGITPVANSYVIETLPDEAQGASWGFPRTCFFLVGATGSIFVGAMVDRNLFDEAFIALAALTTVAAVFFALLRWNMR